MAEMTYWNGLTPSMLEVTNMFLIFGLALLQVTTLPDALGYGNCRIKKNISAAFTMLNLNIAELIPDHGNTQRKQGAGDLKNKVQFGRIEKW